MERERRDLEREAGEHGEQAQEQERLARREPLRDPRQVGRARGPEWVALVGLVAVLVLFGMVPWLAIAPIDTATVPLLARIVTP